MKVQINGVEYEYIDCVVENKDIREKFIDFIRSSFDFDFTDFYKEGYWTDKYEPHVLMKDNKIVTTVTVNYMVYRFEGKDRNYIQLGGVVTREKYRKLGLSRWLMRYIIDRYRDQCDQIFLCSNDSAVEFYPKCGFEPVIEYVSSYDWQGEDEKLYKQEKIKGHSLFEAKKIYIDNLDNREILKKCYAQSNEFTIFPSVASVELAVFYGLGFEKECIYHFPQLRVIVFAQLSKEEMFIEDIFGTVSEREECKDYDKMELLKVIIYGILTCNHREQEKLCVKLGFTPVEELKELKVRIHEEVDDTLFLLKGKENLFKDHQLRFPVLSHN